jgi:hypothetical protein
MPWERTTFWRAGEYTLLVYSRSTEGEVTYSKGETVWLDAHQATRLGNEGSIAPPDGMRAVKARVEGGLGSRRDLYLYQLWELAGCWEDRG